MLRRGAGARGSRLPATAARCLRRPLPAASTDGNWGLVEGGRLFKVRQREASAWEPGGLDPGREWNGVGAAASAELPRPPGRPLAAPSPRAPGPALRGARCGFASSSFASSSSSGLLSSFSSSSSSSSSFSSSSSPSSSSFPTSSPSATASSFATTTPSGAPRSLQSPRPAPPLPRPPGSRAGGTHGRTDGPAGPCAQLSAAAPRGPASGKRGSPPEPREVVAVSRPGCMARRLNTQGMPSLPDEEWITVPTMWTWISPRWASAHLAHL
ncbi:uncharacterized protein [Canis lupus baileyi]|uniref:uncharacterized protein n=1 Tax=Canis lupus baileyi TaxID=143281 RepID=UPI000BAA0C90|nr:putative protein TPRXL [Canis lupus dingo]|eukprot:XP_022267523.1 putative protein TPRXL [Canis lupus familiaris]